MNHTIIIPDDLPQEVTATVNGLIKDITEAVKQAPSVRLCYQVRDALPGYETEITAFTHAVYITHLAKSFTVLPEIYRVWRRVFGVRHDWNTKPRGAELSARFCFAVNNQYIYATLELDIDGATCSAVKVGERTVTMPVYEMRCDGAAVDTKLPEVEE